MSKEKDGPVKNLIAAVIGIGGAFLLCVLLFGMPDWAKF